jgi:hypothetical protein
MTVPFVTLGLIIFVLGCGEQYGSKPVPTKEESKKIKEDMKRSMQEFRKARGGGRQN